MDIRNLGGPAPETLGMDLGEAVLSHEAALQAARRAAKQERPGPIERVKERMCYLPLMAAVQDSWRRRQWARVVITRAHDTFTLPLIYHVALGTAFGVDQPVELRLVAKEENQGMLRGRLEQMAACAPLPLRDIVIVGDEKSAFPKSDVIFLVPYKERVCDELHAMRKRNYLLFRDYGVALKQYAPPHARVVCMGHHACVYATLCALFAGQVIPERNITAVARLQEAKARGMSVPKMHLSAPTAAGTIRGVIVWGHPPMHCLPDVSHAEAPAGNVSTLIANLHWERTALREPVPTELWNRPLVLSGGWALAAAAHVRDWWNGTPEDVCVPMCVASDGSYNVPEHMVFSFPVTVTADDREWHICRGRDVSHFTEVMVAAAVRQQRRHLRLALLTLLRCRGTALPRTPITPPSLAESSSWIGVGWCGEEETIDPYRMWGALGYIDDADTDADLYENVPVDYQGDDQWDPSKLIQKPEAVDWDDDWAQVPAQYDSYPDQYPENEQIYQPNDQGYQADSGVWPDQGAGQWGQGQSQTSEDWRDRVPPEVDPQDAQQWGAGTREHWQGPGQDVQGVVDPAIQRQEWEADQLTGPQQ